MSLVVFGVPLLNTEPLFFDFDPFLNGLLFGVFEQAGARCAHLSPEGFPVDLRGFEAHPYDVVGRAVQPEMAG